MVHSRRVDRAPAPRFAITAFVALRLAFSTVHDALGYQPETQLAQSLPSEVRDAVTYGRPAAQVSAV